MPACSRSFVCSPDPAETQFRARRVRLRRGTKVRRGVTLVEMMIGITIAGTACLGGVAGMLMALRTADSNLLALQAASAARSVSEQLLAVNYLTLFASELPVDVPSQPGGVLIANTWNSRTIDIHQTPHQPHDDLQLRIKPSVTRITQASGLDYAQVVLQYEWLDSSFFAPRTRSDTLTTLAAPISSF